MDIVKRLRNPSPPNIQFVMYEWMREAADEIERLRKALKEICHVTGSDMEAYDIAENALKEKE